MLRARPERLTLPTLALLLGCVGTAPPDDCPRDYVARYAAQVICAEAPPLEVARVPVDPDQPLRPSAIAWCNQQAGIAWIDGRDAQAGVYFRRIDRDGRAVGDEIDLLAPLRTPTRRPLAHSVDVVCDPTVPGGFGVAFTAAFAISEGEEDCQRRGHQVAWFARLGPDGHLLDDPWRISAVGDDGDGGGISLVADGASLWASLWAAVPEHDCGGGLDPRIYMTSVEPYCPARVDDDQRISIPCRGTKHGQAGTVDGRVAVVYTDQDDGRPVVLSTRAADGTFGAPIRLTDLRSFTAQPSFDSDPGGLGVAWLSTDDEGAVHLMVGLLDAQGDARPDRCNTEVRLASGAAGELSAPRVAWRADPEDPEAGEYGITWWHRPAGQAARLLLARVDTRGRLTGRVAQVGDPIAAELTRPDVVATPDGFMITWLERPPAGPVVVRRATVGDACH